MDWFEKWFDSPLYEKLYANRDEDEAERLVEFLVHQLELDRCSKILDLGCGRGRHSINLNKRGYHVKGIDLSEQAIATARSKAEDLSLQNISFEVRDMRNPLPEKFDAIVNLFTTFGYFYDDEENTSVFDSVKSMLEPGGTFVLDYLNAVKVRQSFIPEDEGEFQGIGYHIERYIKDDAIFKDISFRGASINGTKVYSERVKLYDLEWFKQEMGKKDLEIEHIFGDYEGNDFNPESSPRLLLISHLR